VSAQQWDENSCPSFFPTGKPSKEEQPLTKSLSIRTRPGERVAKRRRAKASIGSSHKIHQTETMKWFKNRFDGIIR
jgi:hypothetical protein